VRPQHDGERRFGAGCLGPQTFTLLKRRLQQCCRTVEHLNGGPHLVELNIRCVRARQRPRLGGHRPERVRHLSRTEVILVFRTHPFRLRQVHVAHAWPTWYAHRTHVSATAQPLRILIADRDPFFRRGIREILNEADDLNVVGDALDGESAIHLARELRPRGLDVVLLDVEIARTNGFATAERLAQDPALAVIILTVTEVEPDLLESIRVGATGYLRKTLTPAALVRALQGFHRGESLPMSRAMARTLFSRLRAAAVQPPSTEPPLPYLTTREKEVCELIARGARDREIATQLMVSESTVKKHVQHILRKLHARNRAEAVARLGPRPTSQPSTR
jgi:DNA-binding NarL/FixJ family response regulator